MTRRDWHTLAAYATIAALLLAVAVFVVMLWAVLRHSANAGGAPIQPRPTPTVASRSLVRPFLTVPPPSDHAAAGRDQTSPSASASAVPARRSVAASPPAPAATAGEGEQEGGKIADKHGTLKQRIAWCESRGLNVVNPSSGASGFWQFLDGTFGAVTGLPGKASNYPLSVQSQAFDELCAQQGTRPWRASRSCWGRS